MTLRHTTTQKFISSLIIFTMLVPSVFLSLKPKEAEAVVAFVPVSDLTSQGFLSTIFGSTYTNTAFHLKDFAIALGKELLKLAAKRLLAKMTQATVNWINSGFHGAPLFLENPESFFKDIAKSEITSLIDLFGYDPNRFPFGKQFALNTIASYKSQLETNAQYTLSKVINDPALLNRYRNDFNTGGWNGFLINTQYPQNNYLGFQMLASEELARRLEGTVQNAAQKVQTTLQQGLGFLSPQMCPKDINPSYNNGYNEFVRPSFKSLPFDTEKYPGASGSLQWEKENNVAKAEWTKANTCLRKDGTSGLVATTPGSVAANQVFSALNVPYLSTALDGAIGNSVAAIFDALINKLLDTGLNALSSAVSSLPSLDNWSYDGQTLNGGTTISGTTTSGGLNIPQNVSLRVGETTSTAISGGTAPYSIQVPPNAILATATIDVSGSSGPELKVTAGTTPGTTSFKVKDSSTPTKTVVVTITISAIGSLIVSPANILANTLNPTVASISGGEEPYFIQTAPNESFVISILSGTNLIVTGIAKGNTMIVIRDSSTPPKTVIVPIAVNSAEDLVIPNVSVGIGKTNDTAISGGTAPYFLTSNPDLTVANAQINSATPNMITVTGVAEGETSVLVTDSSNPSQNVTVFISTIPPLGTCTIRKTNIKIQNISEKQCNNSNGKKWVPNDIP